MEQNGIDVHCKQCSHSWTVPMKLPMPIERFVAATKGLVAAGCPSCGATGDDILCGSGPRKLGDFGQAQLQGTQR